MSGYGHGPEVAAALADWTRRARAELAADVRQHVADADQVERDLAAERDARHAEW